MGIPRTGAALSNSSAALQDYSSQPTPLESVVEHFYVHALRWAPKSTLSHLLGIAAKQPIPRHLRKWVYETFAKFTSADLSEAEHELEDYPHFDALFTRRLKPGLRPVVADPAVIVSPCDGIVSAYGIASMGHLIQAKNHDYRLAALLANRNAAAQYEGGAYMTFYLAPGNYHRVHCHLDGMVTGYHHIPGALFSVNRIMVQHINGVFSKNERLVTYLDTVAGEVAIVMVAAIGVGHITVTYDAVATHDTVRGRPGQMVEFSAPRPVRKGEELGTFHMGSTVIILFQPGRVKLESLHIGQSVVVGQSIGYLVAGND